jgi:hypothetical protein
VKPTTHLISMKTSSNRVFDFASNLSKSQQPSAAGFSLVDLLTTIGILLLTVVFLSPAFARTRVHDRAYMCLNNIRQLGLAWRMYAEDNGDHVPPNTSGSSPTAGWVNGWLNFQSGNRDNTNVAYLLNAKLGPYTKSASIYKCPADVYPCYEAGVRWVPRVRSVSMNAYVGVANSAGVPTSSPTVGYYAYQKISDIIRPQPANLWVFAEEHPDSINDGWFVNGQPVYPFWTDLPASYHDGACSIGFADQHAEMHKWMDGYNAATGAGTLQPVLQIQHNGFTANSTVDTGWFLARTSAPIQ